MKFLVLGTLFLLLGGSYLSSRQFCACTSSQTGVSSVSWTGLNRISSLEYHDDYKDQVFRLCTLVCQPVNFNLPTVNLTTGLPRNLSNNLTSVGTTNHTTKYNQTSKSYSFGNFTSFWPHHSSSDEHPNDKK